MAEGHKQDDPKPVVETGSPMAEGLPKQGSKFPWRLRMNYFADLLALRFGKLDDGVLTFPNGEATYAPTGQGRAAWTLSP